MKKSSVGWLLVAASKMHKNRMHNSMHEGGLGQFGPPFLLFLLSTAPGDVGLSQKEVVKQLSISPAAVTVSVQRFEKAGLLKKLPDTADARRNALSITPKGMEFVKECRKVNMEVNEALVAGFSQEELDIFTAYLQRLVDNLEAMGASVPHHPPCLGEQESGQQE